MWVGLGRSSRSSILPEGDGPKVDPGCRSAFSPGASWKLALAARRRSCRQCPRPSTPSTRVHARSPEGAGRVLVTAVSTAAFALSAARWSACKAPLAPCRATAGRIPDADLRCRAQAHHGAQLDRGAHAARNTRRSRIAFNMNGKYGKGHRRAAGRHRPISERMKWKIDGRIRLPDIS